MLPREKPQSYDEAGAIFELSTKPEGGFFRIRRRFAFQFMPKGFFSRLAVRIMRIPQATCDECWAFGLIFVCREERVKLDYDDLTSSLVITGLVPYSK